MPSAGDCKTDAAVALGGIAPTIYTAWTTDGDAGLSSGATVSGSLMRKLLGAQINAIAAAIAGNASSQNSYSVVSHLNAIIARGATNPTLGAGSITVGQAFYASSPIHIQGARFYWLGGGGALSVKCSIWKDTGTTGTVVMTRQEFATVSVNAAGIYTVTWSGGSGSGGSYPLTGADLYKRWCVSTWETTGAKISQTTYSAWGASFAPLPPDGYNNQNTPFPLLPGVWIESPCHTGLGDNPPVSISNGAIALVEPIFTVD